LTFDFFLWYNSFNETHGGIEVKGQRIAVLTALLLVLASLMMVSRVVLPESGGQAAPSRGQPDTEAPVIHGVRDLVVDLLAAPAYRQGVSVTDNAGEATLEIDSAGVDTGVPGEYTVTYLARDAAGNEARATAKVTVTSASEKELARLADPILEEILPAGADDTEKALAIHAWIQANIIYTNEGEKNSVVEGAYNGLTLRQGDCYTYYALAKYFLGRAGIESIDMVRVPTAETRHYWLLVDLGEGWHHYDACPILREHKKLRPRSGFMLTQSEAEDFSAAYGRPEFYSFPAECLPEGVEIVQ